MIDDDTRQIVNLSCIIVNHAIQINKVLQQSDKDSNHFCLKLDKNAVFYSKNGSLSPMPSLNDPENRKK
jgi:hypothetical protein